MGAQTFVHYSNGKSAKEAFSSAVQEAQYDHGHSGYTGTIAEKDDYVMIEVPDGTTPSALLDDMLMDGDPRIDDKWGPAGCIKLEGSRYVFFGWASS